MQTAIVGGGIVGLASAYYLSQRGVDVTVLEKGSLGSGSTGRANGGIRAHFTSPVSTKLSQRSIEVWESFEDDFDTDLEYRRPGYLFMARTEATAERFRENVRKQSEFDVDSEFVSPERAGELCPGLHADQFLGGAYSPNDGIADPHLGLQGFSTAANEAGTDIRTGVTVTDVVLDDNGAVAGVETSEGTVEADFVVNAAGPWASQIAEMAGLDVPVVPKRRKLVIVDPETPVPENTPFTIDADRSVHFRPEREGKVVAGGHFAETDPAQNPDNFEECVPLEWSAQVVEAAADTAGNFGPSSKIRRAWAGLYAVTPDHHPIIEESLSGFVNAIGFSGHGFMQSPATGQVVAELIVDEEATSIDISSLTAERFEGGSPLAEGTVID